MNMLPGQDFTTYKRMKNTERTLWALTGQMTENHQISNHVLMLLFLIQCLSKFNISSFSVFSVETCIFSFLLSDFQIPTTFLPNMKTSHMHKLCVCLHEGELARDMLHSANCVATNIRYSVNWCKTHTNTHRKGTSKKQPGISWAGNLPFNKGMPLRDTCLSVYVCLYLCVCVFALPQCKYLILRFYCVAGCHSASHATINTMEYGRLWIAAVYVGRHRVVNPSCYHWQAQQREINIYSKLPQITTRDFSQCFLSLFFSCP